MLSKNPEDYIWCIDNISNFELDLLISPKEDYHSESEISHFINIPNELEEVCEGLFRWNENNENKNIEDIKKLMNNTKIKYSSEFEKYMNRIISICPCPCLACTEPYMIHIYNKNFPECSEGFKHKPMFKNIDIILINILVNF
uniref:Uncharacterized protein n=1 Tax=Pithovirus LCDPAC02 TaxID=2506601 RepID=A0A481YP37_9VIRU|nr:MAG: hypothetical protein LCDPAC02_02210 [Pithovirus LCDPAC02]